MLGDIIVRVPSAPSVFPTKEENDARRPDWLTWVVTLPFKALKYFVQTMKTKGFFEFEIIINVLVNSFWFIWIPVLWVCGWFNFFYSHSAGVDFRCWWKVNSPSNHILFIVSVYRTNQQISLRSCFHYVDMVLPSVFGRKDLTSESDVYRRQIRTTKVYPHALKVNDGPVAQVFSQHWPRASCMPVKQKNDTEKTSHSQISVTGKVIFITMDRSLCHAEYMELSWQMRHCIKDRSFLPKTEGRTMST